MLGDCRRFVLWNATNAMGFCLVLFVFPLMTNMSCLLSYNIQWKQPEVCSGWCDLTGGWARNSRAGRQKREAARSKSEIKCCCVWKVAASSARPWCHAAAVSCHFWTAVKWSGASSRLPASRPPFVLHEMGFLCAAPRQTQRSCFAPEPKVLVFVFIYFSVFWSGRALKGFPLLGRWVKIQMGVYWLTEK